MSRKALAWVLAAAGGLALFDRMRRGQASRIEMARFIPASPGDLVGLIRQVEREPEFIPGVERVDLLESGEDWVRYKVHLPAGTWAVFRKTWTADRVAWMCEAGSFGLQQVGLMDLTPVPGGTRIALTVQTTFNAPLAGALASTVSSLYARAAFGAWLDDLGHALVPPPVDSGIFAKTPG